MARLFINLLVGQEALSRSLLRPRPYQPGVKRKSSQKRSGLVSSSEIVVVTVLKSIIFAATPFQLEADETQHRRDQVFAANIQALNLMTP
jgi:hypothetical protein